MPKGGSWRVGVLAEAERINHDLSALPGGAPSTQHQEITDLLDQAREVANGKVPKKQRPNGAWDWWNGTSIESAWQALHLAQEQLLSLEDATGLKVRVPHLMTLADNVSAPTTTSEEAGSLTSPAPDPLVAKQALVSYHARSDATHQAVRSLRNIYFTLAVFIGVMDASLTLAKVTSGAVVGLGALAGALSVVFALQSGTSNGPYNVLLAQALLKIASGSATGLMAVALLAYGDSTLTPDSIKAKVYAVAFGFSQQAFTQLADKRAGVVNAATQPRSSKAATGAKIA